MLIFFNWEQLDGGNFFWGFLVFSSIRPRLLVSGDNQMEGITGFALAVHARLDEWTSRWADEESDCVVDTYLSIE